MDDNELDEKKDFFAMSKRSNVKSKEGLDSYKSEYHQPAQKPSIVPIVTEVVRADPQAVLVEAEAKVSLDESLIASLKSDPHSQGEQKAKTAPANMMGSVLTGFTGSTGDTAFTGNTANTNNTAKTT